MTAISRRSFAVLTAAASRAPALARAEPPVPLIIAEGGSAGERPEDTRSAYDLAIDEGADFIQANLVPTREGVLVARRDNELSATTDIASHGEFAARKTSKTIDGKTVTGWFSEDFTLGELKTLTCRERLPALRPANTKFDGKEPILSLQEVLEIARAGCVRTARTVGVWPRMLHAAYFDAQGLPIEARLAGELNTAGYASSAAAVWVQAFEPGALKAFARLSRLRRMQLIDLTGAPADDPTTPFAQMITPAGLTVVRAYADAIAPDQDLVIDPGAALFPAPTTLILDAHTAGLSVFTRTAQAENAFLPKPLQKGDRTSASFAAQHGDIDRLLFGLYANGVDGLATDLPAAAARARAAAISAIARGRAQQR
ncbi:MAG: glycerophosphodiester phosphodiesterase family protein [Caulobacterales bacterium]